MLRLIGQNALSDFRLSQLFTRLKQILPRLKVLSAHTEYFVDLQGELSPIERERLSDVLEGQINESQDSQGFSLWIIPRFGTQSPWGSKAVDIMHHAGINKVRRLEQACVYQLTLNDDKPLTPKEWSPLLPLLHDRMTESVVTAWQDIEGLFHEQTPGKIAIIPLLSEGKTALENANDTLGLALSADEITYLVDQYNALERDPTDVELMMFAQANSEHCRHKIFKAQFEIDQIAQPDSLFGMIKYTYQHNPKGVLSAYHDNAAVIEGFGNERFYCDTIDKTYRFHEQKVHILMKVETHNHPTAIEPFAGAGTGMGGEIRDEGATGRGARPKAGLCGYTVSNLRLPHLPQPWEGAAFYPDRIVSASEIMLKGPIGGAAFNNEFGRPNLTGYFRTFEEAVPSSKTYYARGYHKPIMIAGGMGNIQEQHVSKQPIPANALIIVLGGPAMKIGLGGGAASSVAQGSSDAQLDFASVQRQNPEMQRRAQQVIDACVACENNPIISIHDVGAGGLANAIPELVHDAGKGASLALRMIPNDEKGMTPLEIWCNESQERYVLSIHKDRLNEFDVIAKRERCPYAVLGHATQDPHLVMSDELLGVKPIDIPQSLLFGNAPQLYKKITTQIITPLAIKTDNIPLDEAISRVLQAPAVADKSFLITIGDRTVTGLVARDQMVGPWQVPVADCAVTASSYTTFTGEAMSMGERPPIALIDPAASAKMAVAEAVLNILASDVKDLSDIRLSCNWMAAAQNAEEEAALYAAVKAVGKELCPTWNITVPVGKDSMSMRSVWQDDKGQYEVVSPMTLVASAFAPVQDIRKTLTPLLETGTDTLLLLVDLAAQQYRLGGSIFAQVTNQRGGEAPNVDAQVMLSFVKALNELKADNLLLAYHDRSDGGLFVTLCEMAFATHVGLSIDLSTYVKEKQDLTAALLTEELGVVIQIDKASLEKCRAIFSRHGLIDALHTVATLNEDEENIIIAYQEKILYEEERKELQALWSKTSTVLQAMRDNPACAKQVYDSIVNDDDPGLFVTMPKTRPAVAVYQQIKPKVAILREQGVNGHNEMAAAFTLAGFEAVDVTMSDLLQGQSLAGFHGLAACGGFSYGDVLGAGKGWAKSILYSEQVREEFATFFARTNTFTLGVCNGCQMLSQLGDIIPGATHWPRFSQNQSQQFEARLSLVEVCKSPSILLNGLEGMIFPIAVAHGEGYAEEAGQDAKVALRFVDNQGKPTQSYPFNPNGSRAGVTGFTSDDGRATIMMPHPERVFKTWQLSWHPKTREQDTPWMSLFNNARNWLK